MALSHARFNYKHDKKLLNYLKKKKKKRARLHQM
jgi:hypothetical protein